MRATRRLSPIYSTDLLLLPARRSKPERAPANAGAFCHINCLLGAWALNGRYRAVGTGRVKPSCTGQVDAGQVGSCQVGSCQVRAPQSPKSEGPVRQVHPRHVHINEVGASQNSVGQNGVAHI